MTNNIKNSQKQHFVPKAYLRQFTSDRKGSFHQLDISSQRLDIRKVHVQNACYFTNYYDIENQQMLKALGLNDPRYLETSFAYENVLIIILDKIRERQLYLSRKEFEVLVEAYVSIKHRVPKYRKEIKKIQGQGTIFDQAAGNLKIELRDLIEHNKFDYDGFVGRLKSEMQSDLEYPKSSHLRALVESAKQSNEPVSDAIRKILSMNIVVLEATGKDDYFFVTDNPGYSLLGNKMFNTNYGAFDKIIWPINSRQVILLNGFDPLNYIRPLIRLRYSPVSSNGVQEFNKMSFLVADEKIFCENRDVLNRFKHTCNAIREEQEKLIEELADKNHL